MPGKKEIHKRREIRRIKIKIEGAWIHRVTAQTKSPPRWKMNRESRFDSMGKPQAVEITNRHQGQLQLQMSRFWFQSLTEFQGIGVVFGRVDAISSNSIAVPNRLRVHVLKMRLGIMYRAHTEHREIHSYAWNTTIYAFDGLSLLVMDFTACGQ